MPAFLGTPLTAHIARLPDGSLLCRSVPLWRSGVQTYRESELANFAGVLPDGVRATDGMVKVIRPVEEVLSPQTLASAEGAPVCDSHPPVFVTPATWKTWSSGHSQNIRPGPRLPDGEVTAVGDLIIRDNPLIDKIANGTREISAGYDCSYQLADDGKSYVQRHIRINHISVLQKGRAGEAIAIQDHAVQRFTLEDVLTKCGQVLARAHLRYPDLRPAIGEFLQDLAPVHAMDAAASDAESYASAMKKLHRREHGR